MVLDLRNNGGGHVISSNMLSTCIAGAACQGKVYEYYRYNDSRMATVEKTARETGKEYDTAAKNSSTNSITATITASTCGTTR